MGICIECWLNLHWVVQQTLLHVPERTTFRELFSKEVASKLVSRDCHEESLAVSVSPTGKGEWKTVGCDDDIRVCFLGAEITVYGSSENRSNECTYCRQSA